MDVLREAILPPDEDTKPEATGFRNPDTLHKAQETRRGNREAREPQSLGDLPDGEAAPKQKRGRQPKRSERSLKQIENMLVQTHFMIASATGFQELIIDQSEANTLAEAMAAVSDYYKIKLDGKTGAFVGLVYAIGIVYGPRAVSIGIRLRRERNGKDTKDADTPA